MEKEVDIILCVCNSDEHQWIIHRWPDEREVYIHVYLATRPFWKRLWYGIKYIFGYRCRFGNWDEIVLDSTHANQFQEIANALRGEENK
jgi:hypothetical protein